ncbi:MAG: hypothetical protein E6J11_12975 [Chloroflexi bacterium]|nr:MAG: hypothetical protein E6J11_12975 [Chloroflexota bacterium]TMD44966.1 MAG: hypothetical protein E6I90_08200 [Chloroflexota bacterium]
MGQKPSLKRPRSFILAPIPIQDQHKQSATPEPGWWARCSNWIRYYSIQIRWDIERWLARRLHRRWSA